MLVARLQVHDRLLGYVAVWSRARRSFRHLEADMFRHLVDHAAVMLAYLRARSAVQAISAWEPVSVADTDVILGERARLIQALMSAITHDREIRSLSRDPAATFPGRAGRRAQSSTAISRQAARSQDRPPRPPPICHGSGPARKRGNDLHRQVPRKRASRGLDQRSDGGPQDSPRRTPQGVELLFSLRQSPQRKATLQRVDETVGRHGGRILVYQRADGATTVTMAFPLEHEAAPERT